MARKAHARVLITTGTARIGPLLFAGDGAKWSTGLHRPVLPSREAGRRDRGVLWVARMVVRSTHEAREARGLMGKSWADPAPA